MKRVIELKSIHAVAPVTVKKHSFAFGIVTSKRTFLVKASSPDEMEDWVRAINGCRRKLSEQEEEDRNKREGKTSGMPMAIPARQQGAESAAALETHQGTYSSVFTNSTSISSSPIATTGYFAPKITSTAPQQGPSSPLDTGNTLTAQMARVTIPRTPSLSTPQSRSASARREPSASSVSSDFMSRSPQPPPVSSDEDEPYFSDPLVGLGTSVSNTPVMMSPTSTGMGNLVIDPKKIILSAYLMKRSKGRGKKVWKKRWFFLTSQGLTYTKSHMVSQLAHSVADCDTKLTSSRILVLYATFPSLPFLTRSTLSLASRHPMRRIPTTRHLSLRPCPRASSRSSAKADRRMATPMRATRRTLRTTTLSA